MSNLNDLLVVVCAIFMIIGVVSVLYYLRRAINRFILKKEKREAAYMIAFYLEEVKVYENGFSIIPLLNTIIILPSNDGGTIAYCIKKIIYNTSKTKKSDKDIIISLELCNDNYLPQNVKNENHI